jgi:hypothetical protein
MSGAVPPFPQYTFMAWFSVKAQGQLYFYIYSSILLYVFTASAQSRVNMIFYIYIPLNAHP